MSKFEAIVYALNHAISWEVKMLIDEWYLIPVLFLEIVLIPLKAIIFGAMCITKRGRTWVQKTGFEILEEEEEL